MTLPWGGRICSLLWPMAPGLEWSVPTHPTSLDCYTWASYEGGSVNNTQQATTAHSQAVIPKK